MASTQFIKGEDCGPVRGGVRGLLRREHAVGVANGTDALILALRAYGIGPGDEVITVANTFIATGEAILLNGARPVFVDVDPATYTMDARQVEAAITPRTKVHRCRCTSTATRPTWTPIMAIADRHGLPVLEDAAQAHGAAIGGRRAGSLGHAACFSFYPGKNLGAYGDAGHGRHERRGFVGRVRQLRQPRRRSDKYDNVVLGTNSRLDELQAAVLRVKLRHLDAWNARAARARDGLRRVRLRALRASSRRGSGRARAPPGTCTRSAWSGRDALQAHLSRRASPPPCTTRGRSTCSPRWPRPAAAVGDLPVSERLSRVVIRLPLYPELPMETLERIAQEIRAFCGAG